MAETTSPTATPKRKRDDLVTELRLSTSPTPRYSANTVFSFQLPSLLPVRRSEDLVEDGNSSPRTKVAQKFGDLALEGSHEDGTAGNEAESGGGAATAAGNHRRVDQKLAPELPRFDFDAGTTAAEVSMRLDSDDDTTARKRTKLFEIDTSSPEPTTDSAAAETYAFAAQPQPPPPPSDDRTNHYLTVSVDPEITSALKAGKSGHLQKSYPSINRLADSKSRSRKRSGTPPLPSKRKPVTQSVEEQDEDEATIVDPVRAALTWREDEITIYDPEDKDDDGTGINGIGFKPTPAVAYQRAQKRRQQLAEYKKREESEARARRNQRRREQGAEMARKHSIVRVHFSDAPPTTVMTT
ncbi:hypothetical protein F5Y19DRAFT_244875 [Xylariaceae sp. FL1651]|nr:hypothetical protein F5Y19DRAFT_244875 [Xylariaceae sp. FL1651]